MDWQPIETAKVGQRAILWNGDEMYFGELVDGRNGPGWSIWGFDDIISYELYAAHFDPTHWLPLPFPPKSQ